MSTATFRKNRSRNGKPPIFPLRNGEHLSREEFERRWEATPSLRRAELIEGIVFMPPPISATHSDSHGDLYHWLALYADATPGVKSSITPSLRLDNRNEYQPDCVLRIIGSDFGRSRVSSDDYLEGTPELVAEIAVSSADYDAHEKRAVYERLGIQEYLLWEVMDAHIEWCELERGKYVPLHPRKDGVHCSRAFPGLWLDLRALVRGQKNRVTKVLDRGLKSAEHAAFVRKLSTK